jgi:predicted RNA-binding Zn ribbon-like protein
MTDAALVVALANAQADRRPSRARHVVAHDALADVASANAVLGPFVDGPVDARELPRVRALQRAVVVIAAAVIDGSRPPLGALNALAARAPVILALEPHGERLRATVHPERAGSVPKLLAAVIEELSALEPSRLRRCARPECKLVFYDASRSATQRWHAERPCGLRERQRRRRAQRPA